MSNTIIQILQDLTKTHRLTYPGTETPHRLNLTRICEILSRVILTVKRIHRKRLRRICAAIYDLDYHTSMDRMQMQFCLREYREALLEFLSYGEWEIKSVYSILGDRHWVSVSFLSLLL